MANLSSVDFSTGVLSSATTGTVMTINAVAAVAGTPAANAMTVQPSSIPFSVAVSSITGGTITSLTSGTVAVSGGTITSLTSGTVVISSGTLTSLASGTVNITGGTITSLTSGTVVISSGTLTSLSSGTVAIGNAGVVAAVRGASSAPTAADNALVVSISPNSVNANGTALSSNSAPVTMASNQATMAVAQDTSLLVIGQSSNTVAPNFVNIAGATGRTVLVSSQASKKIRVLAWDLTAAASGDIDFRNGTSSSILAGPYHADGIGWGIAQGYNPVGYFQTASSEGLAINLATVSSAGGSLVYILV